MGFRLKSSARASARRWLGNIGLLLFLGEVTCLLGTDNPFEITSINWSRYYLARNDATKNLDGESKLSSPGLLHDIGITGNSKSPYDLEQAKKANQIEPKKTYVSHVKLNMLGEEMSESDRIRETLFEDQVNRPLLRCLNDVMGIPLTKPAKDDLEELIITTMDDVVDTFVTLPLDVAHELSKTSSKKVNHDELALSILNKIQKALNILRDPEYFTDKPSLDIIDSRLLSMGFRLSDIFLRYLAASEKYNLISGPCLREIINEKTQGQLVLNYILRYLCYANVDILSRFLSYDLKRSVELSGFTEEIHDVLKYLKLDTWKEIERFHMIALVQSTSLYDKRIEPLGCILTQQTSPRIIKLASQKAYDQIIEELYESICHLIFTTKFQTSSDDKNGQKLGDLMVLQHMLSFLVKNHVSPENMNKIKKSVLFPRVLAFDEAMGLYFDALKVIYIEYGKLLKAIALNHPRTSSDRALVSNLKKYLTDSVPDIQGLFTTHNTPQEDLDIISGKFQAKKAKDGLQKFGQDQWIYPNRKLGLDFLSAKHSKFASNYEEENDLEASKLIIKIKELAQLLFDNFDSLSLYTDYFNRSETDSLLRMKIFLGQFFLRIGSDTPKPTRSW